MNARTLHELLVDHVHISEDQVLPGVLETFLLLYRVDGGDVDDIDLICEIAESIRDNTVNAEVLVALQIDVLPHLIPLEVSRDRMLQGAKTDGGWKFFTVRGDQILPGEFPDKEIFGGGYLRIGSDVSLQAFVSTVLSGLTKTEVILYLMAALHRHEYQNLMSFAEENLIYNISEAIFNLKISDENNFWHDADAQKIVDNKTALSSMAKTKSILDDTSDPSQKEEEEKPRLPAVDRNVMVLSEGKLKAVMLLAAKVHSLSWANKATLSVKEVDMVITTLRNQLIAARDNAAISTLDHIKMFF
jgi:hypothetical protein